jgi:DNA gyrase/topoisomerase IV subunit B
MSSQKHVVSKSGKSSKTKTSKNASKSKNQYLTGDDYQHLSEAERMMKLEMYTGSRKQKPREEWIYNFETNTIEKDIITTPECVERCFLESLTNASDNVGRSRRFKTNPGKIIVHMTPKTITIENSGVPIPVEYKEENEMYVPELIFGTPGSSSHYTEETRHEAGVNGLGVKLTNMFSTILELDINDPIRGKSYHQV